MKSHIIASIILLISFSPVEAQNAVAAPAMAAEMSIPAVSHPAVYSDDPRLVELGKWALGRFGAAGLEVPAIEIHLHATDDACGGHRGTFNPGQMRVDVCAPVPGVILHELAHAWAHHHVGPDTRAAYVAMQGLESWNDSDTPWSARGSEHAADTVAWGLLETTITNFTADGPIARRAEAYRVLTGSDVPRLDV